MDLLIPYKFVSIQTIHLNPNKIKGINNNNNNNNNNPSQIHKWPTRLTGIRTMSTYVIHDPCAKVTELTIEAPLVNDK